MSLGVRIGIDVGGSHVRCARVRPDGTIAGRTRRVLSAKDPTSVAALCAALIDEVHDGDDVPHVGIGLAAMLTAPDAGGHRTVQNAPNLGWRNVDFRALVAAARAQRGGARAAGGASRAALRPRLWNDAEALLLGEMSKGAARAASDVLLVSIGTGVGAAACIGGHLITGAHGAAMELGHVAVVARNAPDARRCGCGQRGCLEAYASGRMMHEALRTLFGADDDARSDAAPLFARAAQEQPAHLDALFADATRRIARVVADAALLLGPALIVMGGGLYAPYDARLKALCTATADALHPVIPAQVVPMRLGDDAGVIGAALGIPAA